MFEYEGTDPVSAAQEAAEAISRAKREVEAKGIKSFLFNSASPEEFDQRASIREVSEVIATTSDKYLGSREGHAKITAALRREFVAQYTDDNAGREQEYLDSLDDEDDEDEDEELGPIADGTPCKVCGRGWTNKARCSECKGAFCNDSHSCGRDAGEGSRNTACDGCWPSHGGGDIGLNECPDCESSPPCTSAQDCTEKEEQMWDRKQVQWDSRQAGAVVTDSSKYHAWEPTPGLTDTGACKWCGKQVDDPVHDASNYQEGEHGYAFTSKRARCSTCGEVIERPRDEESLREASTSGMCQNCQDDFFGVEKESSYPYEAPEGFDFCPTCKGSGTTSGEFQGQDENDVCPTCKGSGTKGLDSKQAKGCSCTCDVGGDCSCGKKCGKSCKCHCTRKKKSSTNDLPAWVREAQVDLGQLEEQGEVT